jgi:hypothetical protein
LEPPAEELEMATADELSSNEAFVSAVRGATDATGDGDDDTAQSSVMLFVSVVCIVCRVCRVMCQVR